MPQEFLRRPNDCGQHSLSQGKDHPNLWTVELRILLKIGLDESTSIKLSYIKTRQYLQLVTNTIAITPVDYWKLSDPMIKPAAADQVAGGIFKNFQDDQIETSIEGFYKKSTNLLDYETGVAFHESLHRCRFAFR